MWCLKNSLAKNHPVHFDLKHATGKEKRRMLKRTSNRYGQVICNVGERKDYNQVYPNTNLKKPPCESTNPKGSDSFLAKKPSHNLTLVQKLH